MTATIRSTLGGFCGATAIESAQQSTDNSAKRVNNFSVSNTLRTASNLLKAAGGAIDRFRYAISPTGRFIAGFVDLRTKPADLRAMKNMQATIDKLCTEAPNNMASALALTRIVRCLPKEIRELGADSRFVSARSEKATARLGIPAEQIRAALDHHKEIQDFLAQQLEKAKQTIERLPENQKRELQTMMENHRRSAEDHIMFMVIAATAGCFAPAAICLLLAD